jgi:hypothetical protein
MRAHTVSMPIEDNISAIDSPQRCFAGVTAGGSFRPAVSPRVYRGGHWIRITKET